jgi:hypothetical protein
MAALGPVGQRMRAERERARREREAEQRRRHGSDFTALEPCAHCGDPHPPGFCRDPSEHDLVCVAASERCPRPCLAVCVLAICCPRCRASHGEACARGGTDPLAVVHPERWAAADRIALQQTPQTISAAWGEEGLRDLRRQLRRAPMPRRRPPSEE